MGVGMGSMCLLYRKLMVSLVVVIVVVSVLNEVGIGLPVASQTSKGSNGTGEFRTLPVMIHSAKAQMRRKEDEGSKRQVNEESSTGIESAGRTSVSDVELEATNRNASRRLAEEVVEGTVRILNASLATSPADVQMSERGMRGMIKGVSSSVKNLGENLRKLVHMRNKELFKVLSRNESMVVVGVGGMRVSKGEMAEGRSRSEKVSIDGKNVMVAVKGCSRDGSEETRELKIKIGGKYNVSSEDVYVIGDGEDKKWGIKIMIPRRRKKKEEDEKECREKHGENEIGRDVCVCEKMKIGKARLVDVECLNGIGEKVMNTNEWRCKEKKGMQSEYECVVKKLRELSGDGSKSSKSHGRSILSWSGWNEAGDFGEEEDEEEELEGEQEEEEHNVMKEVMMYIIFASMLVLVMVCLNDLIRQYGRYREERGRAYAVVRLPEYAQTIYSRMIRG